MPRLSDQERQEINRHLEADKPLPDKYRFLLFQERREVELVWNGKTGEVTNVVLPFQVIEQVDEPRAEKPADATLQLEMFDTRGRQVKGWTNKLIWGDNKLILSSLKNGPLREEIEKEGGLKLIYIDPPFDVGADFSMDIEIGDDTFTKKANILEEIAYRDTWGKGTDSFMAMIYERLVLMHDLLAQDGTIYVHCDWRLSSYLRLVLDEVFGNSQFKVDIQWQRVASRSGTKSIPIIHDTILVYSKSDDWIYNPVYESYDESYLESHYNQIDERGRKFRWDNATASGEGPSRVFFGTEIAPPRGTHWRWTQENIDRLIGEGRIGLTAKGKPQYKRYLDEMPGRVIQSIWSDISPVNSQAVESLGYPTQKPEQFMTRILNTSSNPGDVVADLFCGSGTLAAVAEKLGRKWIVADLGKFAIHTTRKRVIGVQRQLKAAGKDYRAFEILNLGKYERQHYIGVNLNLRETEQQEQLAEKEAEFVDLILRAYRAERTEGFATFHGKKAGRLVVVGPINLPVTRLFVEEVILECRQKQISRVDILGFEFEMGLFPNILDEARSKGMDIAPKYIPAEVFDKRAVERNQVVFHDVSFIEVKPHIKKNTVAVELTDFSVFYSQDSVSEAETTLKDKASKIVVENGQIVKVSKDKHGIVSREALTRHWTDWIDYWSVDFDFESKREVIRVSREQPKQVQIPEMQQPDQIDLPEYEEKWTGDYIFENEWQSFRTKKDRKLELTSVYHECEPGRRKVAIKVVDIFGTDTMTIVEVQVGGRQ